MNNKISLSYLFKTFLKIGAVSWGGHISLVSMARKKIVEDDNVMTDELVMESISLASILPGPLAVNIVAYWGYKIKGWKGSVVSAIGVLLPAFVALLILTIIYFKYAHLLVFQSFFKGIMSAVSAIIFAAGISMAKKQKLDYAQIAILVISIVAFYSIKGYWVSFCFILFGGLIGMLLYNKKIEISKIEKNMLSTKNNLNIIILFIVVGVIIYAVSTPILKILERQFSFISLSQIGGGYVVIPSMEKIFVDSLHWLTHQEFVDGIALSQITPGPIFIISEFIGYKMDGFIGCLIATISVYFPSAFLIIMIGNLFQKIQNNSRVKAAFKGIHPVVIGMVFSAAIKILAQKNIPITVFVLFLIALLLLLKTKVSAPILLLSMGIIGLIFY